MKHLADIEHGAETVIKELKRLGGEIRGKNGDSLKVLIPPGRMTPTLRKAIKAFKDEIIELLNPPEIEQEKPKEPEVQPEVSAFPGLTNEEKQMFALADSVEGTCVMAYGTDGYRYAKPL